MSSLVFATNNAHKIAEIRSQLGTAYNFFSLQEIACHEELPETTPTLEGNARQKAHFVKDHYGYDCFSEDTGLEIDALDGRPGVDTAHYAGPERSAAANNAKVLAELGDTDQRTARFRTIICLVQDEKEYLFEGRCEGHIARVPSGGEGFGYDPIFVPVEGDGRSFAEMGMEQKSQMSHRARAMQQLQEFLTRQADQ